MRTRCTRSLSSLPVGWIGYYQRAEAGNVWWWCRVVGYDDGAPVVVTAKGRYHRIPLSSRFYTQVPRRGIMKGEPRALKETR